MIWYRMPLGIEAHQRAALEDAARHVEAACCALQLLVGEDRTCALRLAEAARAELVEANRALVRALMVIRASNP